MILGRLRRIRGVILFESVLTAIGAGAALTRPRLVVESLIGGGVTDDMLVLAPVLGAAWIVVAVMLRVSIQLRDAAALRAVLWALIAGGVVQVSALIVIFNRWGQWGSGASIVHIVMDTLFVLNLVHALLEAENLAASAPPRPA